MLMPVQTPDDYLKQIISSIVAVFIQPHQFGILSPVNHKVFR